MVVPHFNTSTTRTYGNLSISLCCCSGKSHTRFHGTWTKRSIVGRKIIPPKQMLWCLEAWRILHGARTTLLSFLNPTDTIHRTFILNMPRPVVEMLEGKFKADAITDLTNYSLAQLYQMAAELIQNHCRNQDLWKHMKQIEKTYLSTYCNDKPNKFSCHDSSNSCSCLRKSHSKKKKKGLETLQKQKAPLCEKAEVQRKVRQVFHLW